MASNRRIGQEQSKTRMLLLDAAEQIMLEEGYAAVSSRRVAARAGLKPQLVHYYFRSMDALYLAMLRRRVEETITRYQEALDSPEPLHAIWEISRDPAGTGMIVEINALANHRKEISAEIARYGEQVRAIQVQALSRVFAARGIDPVATPPQAVAVLLSGISLFLRMEEAVGMSGGHAEIEALVEQTLWRLEPSPAQPRRESEAERA